jgi:hypothetical protein
MSVKCDFFNHLENTWLQYEIDLELNVFPCCYYYTDYVKDGHKDPLFEDIDINLKSNSFENIKKEYDKKLNLEIWSSKKCPKVCQKYCQKK